VSFKIGGGPEALAYCEARQQKAIMLGCMPAVRHATTAREPREKEHD
jgi:hypothetical protein